jgi:hypothetical protein
MTTYIYKPECYLADKHGFVEKSDLYFEWLYHIEPDNRAVIGNQVIQINYIADEMAPTRHMMNGKYYTSKKKFRNETKARGCIEVGNDYAKKARAPIKLDRRQRRDDIKKALYEVKNGRDIIKEIRSLPKD